jgi:hypothetical protein
MTSSGTLRNVVLVRTDDTEERIASIIKTTIIGEVGTTLAVTISHSIFLRGVLQLLIIAKHCS